VLAGDLLFLSGQGADGWVGRLGSDLTVEQGHKAARDCALNLLAQARDALGDLDRVAQVVKLAGFVACTPASPPSRPSSTAPRPCWWSCSATAAAMPARRSGWPPSRSGSRSSWSWWCGSTADASRERSRTAGWFALRWSRLSGSNRSLRATSHRYLASP
jgi:YjgF/chorismate_mutase-like, putative endoribonuclease